MKYSEDVTPLRECMIHNHIENQPLAWDEAAKLQRTYGKNRIEQRKSNAWYAVLFRACIHPFNFLLIFLSIIAGATEDPVTVTILMTMVLLSTILRFVQGMIDNTSEQIRTK